MTKPTEPQNRASRALLSPEEWAEFHRVGLQAAQHVGYSASSQDDIQDAIAGLLAALARGRPIHNPQGYLWRAVHHAAYSRRRSGLVAAKYARFVEPEPPLNPAEEYTQGKQGIREIVAELWACLNEQASFLTLFENLFAKIVLFGSDPSWCSPRILGRGRGRRSTVDRLIANLDRRGISVGDLYTVLRIPSAILSCAGLTRLMAQAAARVIQEVQDVSKQCRLDILMRASISRQDIYVSKLPLFAKDLDLLYVAARMPREYTLLGMVTCLQNLFKVKQVSQEVRDHNYVENFLRDVIENKPGIHPMDRWLAIASLGILYEQADAGLTDIEKVLSPIEETTKHHPVQKIGMAFAWIDAATRDKGLMMREKVYPLLDPEHWHAGLSQLPITVIGSYMGSTPEALSTALALPETWYPILQGLQSKSYMANLGALAQLNHMPYVAPPSALQADLKTALYRAQAAAVPLLRERAKRVPSRYCDGDT